MQKPDDIHNSIFFACYGGGHAAAVAPVAAALRARDLPTRILALTTARRTFERVGLPTLGMADIHRKVPSYRRAHHAGLLLARGQPTHGAVPLEETAAYLGVGFHAMARSHGLSAARQRYDRLGRQSFLPVDFFLELFRIERPRVVVGTSAPRAERAMFEAARELGIPSICIVDLYAPFEIEWCASTNFATRICVLNDSVVARFVERGVPRERVVATGNPAFDRLRHVDQQAASERYRAQHGLDAAAKLVVWISQPEPAVHPFAERNGNPQLPKLAERALARYFADREDVFLVMRLHPSEDRPAEVAGARVRYGNSSEPLDELLCAADCVVTASSTVGLEAAMLGKPVVQCMDSIFSDDLPLAKLGYAVAVDTHMDAGPAVDKLLDSLESAATTSFDLNAFDASVLITEQILSLCSTHGEVS